MSEVDRSLNSFRLQILSALHIGKPASTITIPKEVLKVPQVSEPYQKEEKIEKPEEPPLPEVPPLKEKEEVVTREEVVKKEEVVRKEIGIVKEENWVVHVVSVRNQKEAMIYKERLMAGGFPAYSIRAKVKGEDWIRVRVGFFTNKDEAQKISKEIGKKFIAKGPYWITKVSAKEMEDLLGK